MEASDELLTIAELSVALAGFAGVVTAFTHRGELGLVDRNRFIELFSLAISALVLAFVPFGFHHAGQAGATLWAGSSAVMLVVWAASAFFALRLRRGYPTELMPPQVIVNLLWGLPVFNVVLQLANFLGWPFVPGPLPYFAGLLIWLVVTAFLFVLLVVYRPRE